MSEHLPEEIQNEEIPEVSAPPAQTGWTPSESDFKALQAENQRISAELAQITELFQEPEPDLSNQLDLTNPDHLAYYVDQVANQRVNQALQGVTPYVKSAAQDQGQKEMHRMFDIAEKDLKENFPAGFDRDLAERTAFYFFDQSGDAEGAVRAAAEYAAQVRKSDRDAALEEARSRATRSGRGASDEPGAGASAVPSGKKFKTYDEVIDAYAHQTEV